MSSILNSVKNSFKHPEDESESASGYGRESQRAGQAATGDLNPDETSTAGSSGQQPSSSAQGAGTATQGVGHNGSATSGSSGPVKEVMESVPSTGYVGDNTGGRFPGQGQSVDSMSSSAGGSPPSGQSTDSSSMNKSHQDTSGHGSHHGSHTETGREGVPGTVTSGDPSMGGKENSATGNSERLGSNQNTAGVVQNGDPSMGGKYTRAEGINQ